VNINFLNTNIFNKQKTQNIMIKMKPTCLEHGSMHRGKGGRSPYLTREFCMQTA